MVKKILIFLIYKTILLFLYYYYEILKMVLIIKSKINYFIYIWQQKWIQNRINTIQVQLLFRKNILIIKKYSYSIIKFLIISYKRKNSFYFHSLSQKKYTCQKKYLSKNLFFNWQTLDLTDMKFISWVIDNRCVAKYTISNKPINIIIRIVIQT